jgi:hypothetical protein
MVRPPALNLGDFRWATLSALDLRQTCSYNVAADEIGTVVDVEPHPPRTGPTYDDGFRRAPNRFRTFFRFEYELAKAATVEDDPLAPYAIVVEPHGPLGNLFVSLDQALEAARGLKQGGVKIRSINKGTKVLDGAKLRVALGENKQREFVNFPSGESA